MHSQERVGGEPCARDRDPNYHAESSTALGGWFSFVGRPAPSAALLRLEDNMKKTIAVCLFVLFAPSALITAPRNT